MIHSKLLTWLANITCNGRENISSCDYSSTKTYSYLDVQVKQLSNWQAACITAQFVPMAESVLKGRVNVMSFEWEHTAKHTFHKKPLMIITYLSLLVIKTRCYRSCLFQLHKPFNSCYLSRNNRPICGDVLTSACLWGIAGLGVV